MKQANRMQIAALVLAAVCSLGAVEARAAIDLTEFEGKYKAKAATVVYADNSYPASATMKVDVAKNGASAKITVNGTLTAGGTAYPLSNTFTLRRNRTIDVASVLFFIEGGAYPATGKFKLKGDDKITYSVVFAGAPTAVIQGTITVKPKGKKKELRLILKIFSEGGLYSFDFKGLSK